MTRRFTPNASKSLLLAIALLAAPSVRGEEMPRPVAEREQADLQNTLPFWSDYFVQHEWRIQKNVATGKYRLVDDQGKVLHQGDFDQCREQFEAMRPEAGIAPVDGKIVLLLHGLFRSTRACLPLQRALEKEGYTVIRVGYASTQAGIDSHSEALQRVISFLPEAKEINFVGHSMGSLVVRKYLSDVAQKGALDPRINRFVMLGPPNHGSAIAQAARESQWLNTVAGQGFSQLGREWNKFQEELRPLPIEFGIIAGNTAEGSGGNPFLEGDDDLVVRVEETKLAGARDFAVVPVIHMGMFGSPAVQQRIVNFLEHGYFTSEETRQPLAPAEGDSSVARDGQS